MNNLIPADTPDSPKTKRWSNFVKSFNTYYPDVFLLFPIGFLLAFIISMIILIAVWIPLKDYSQNQPTYQCNIKNITLLQISEPSFDKFIFVTKWTVEILKENRDGKILQEFPSIKVQQDSLKKYSINSVHQCFENDDKLTWRKKDFGDDGALVVFFVVFGISILCFVFGIMRFAYVKISS